MSHVKQRLLGHIRAIAADKRGPEASRALDRLHTAFYTWTADGDRLQWSPNAAKILDMRGKDLPASGRAFAAMTEPGYGMGRADAIAADAVVSHPRGMPYHLGYVLRLNDNTLAAVEDHGRWFAGHDGFPAMAHGSLTVTGGMDQSLLSAQTVARSEFLAAVNRGAGQRGALRNVGVLAFTAELAPVPGQETRPSLHDHPHGLEILDIVAGHGRRLMRRTDRILLQPDGTAALALMGGSPATLEQAAEQLRRSIEAYPVTITGRDIALKARIGVASAPEHATTALQLLKHAEEALCDATADDRQIVVFTGLDRTYAAMEKSLTAFLAANELLSNETLRDNLVLSHRPLFDAGSRLATLHMIGPGRRKAGCQVEPAEDLRFIADAAGLSPQLDRHLLDLVCGELALCDGSYAVLPVSAATLADPEWPVALAAFLGANPGVAPRLIVGIPESFAASDLDLLERRMNTLKALGAGVAVLDFGGGFLPCHLLSQLPVDMVIIDGALVQNAAVRTDNRFYLRGLIDSAQGRDIVVAATWVEDERTAALLTEWGVNYLEGRIRSAPAAQEDQRRQLRRIA